MKPGSRGVGKSESERSINRSGGSTSFAQGAGAARCCNAVAPVQFDTQPVAAAIARSDQGRAETASAHIKDARVRRLADHIVSAQVREIDVMQQLIEELQTNPPLKARLIFCRHPDNKSGGEVGSIRTASRSQLA